MSKGTPLSELQGEISKVHWIGDVSTRCLWFYWNGQHHGIPFSDTGENIGGRNIWKRASGSTIDDLTLSPSYNCTAPETHRLHCFIRDGQVFPC